jgi:Protein of unknown function (DUF3306)
MNSEPFLSRWSRRKQAIRSAEASQETAPAEADTSAAATHDEAAPPEASANVPLPEAELSADEIAALPSIEELTAETDISGFLRRGVPEPLRNAALRRMWLLDPKIRDFVGDAREYAYDWNTPGGVPGYGPLPATDEIARMAARIVRGETPDPDPHDEPVASAEIHSKDREQLSVTGPDEPMTRPATLHEDADLPSGEAASSMSADQDDASLRSRTKLDTTATSETGPEKRFDPADEPVGPPARRHGGAIPL